MTELTVCLEEEYTTWDSAEVMQTEISDLLRLLMGGRWCTHATVLVDMNDEFNSSERVSTVCLFIQCELNTVFSEYD